ncbi:hypothetical protein PHYSODRAFT_477731, partial [Phytophthora sojae]
SIAKSVLKSDTASTGCENARVEWGKKIPEQAFITLLNCVVRDLNRNGNRRVATSSRSGVISGSHLTRFVELVRNTGSCLLFPSVGGHCAW